MDDTAKAILALRLIGHEISPTQMLDVFEGDKHFRTYPHERDPSISANCNVLLTLLNLPNVTHYAPQIVKTVKFLCDYWWNCDGVIKDKWVRQIRGKDVRFT